MNDVSCLTIRMKPEVKTAWNSILQKGFFLSGHEGMSVRQFMVECLGYDNCLVDESVRTVFLNSSPVDNIDTALVKDGDRLALGSAMPGLVGICMGRDNPYKEFRSGIACHGNEGQVSSEAAIRVYVKIFSTLAVDTGADILARGIEVDAGQLFAFLEMNKAHLLNEEGLGGLTEGNSGDVRVVVEFAN